MLKEKILALALAGASIPMHVSASPKTITAQIFKMPDAVEPAAVTTAGHYILAAHLARALTKLDKFGKIQGDIAAQWELADNRKQWTITLGSAQFSDGRAVTAAHVVASITRQKKLSGGVHFPFDQIERVRALSPTTLEVTLTRPRNDFIYDLAAPEFGVLSPEDAAAPRDHASYAVTSGAYFLASREGNSYHLRRNPHYNGGTQNDLDLILEGSQGVASADALAGGKISFFTTQQTLPAERHAAITARPDLRAERPHIGFSFWLSINPRSPLFAELSQRAALQSYVRAFQSPDFSGHTWEKAEQLYLPDGEGRPSSAELALAWKGIEAHVHAPARTKPHLRVLPLLTANAVTDSILTYLRQRYDVELIPYANEAELQAHLHANRFDVKISSNDFSSIDLSENLKTTFNPVRPYIFLPQGSAIPALLQRSVETNDKTLRAEIFRSIALHVLRDGLIAPIAYQRMWFYHDAALDLSAWSGLFPEISFWKVKVHGR